jgi:hypothetical protein
MKKKCSHRKGFILAVATNVEFAPDQEPFVAGKIEQSGYDKIELDSICIHWCPRCKVVKKIYSDGDSYGHETA